MGVGWGVVGWGEGEGCLKSTDVTALGHCLRICKNFYFTLLHFQNLVGVNKG